MPIGFKTVSIKEETHELLKELVEKSTTVSYKMTIPKLIDLLARNYLKELS